MLAACGAIERELVPGFGALAFRGDQMPSAQLLERAGLKEGERWRNRPREEIYGLTSQLRRAGVSVASHIAEGYGRSTKGEFRSFLGVARGSTLEVQTQLVIARELGLGDSVKIATAEKLADETGRMLWSMREKL
jgi:four helix bundle protein